MPGIDLTPLIIALIGGSGGGALIAWVNTRRQHRLDTRADDVARLAAKKDLRKLVDDVAGEMITSLRADHKEALVLVKEQQEEIRELYRRISLTDAELLEANKQLAVAEAEAHRKESVIVQLKQVVAALEATVAELRQQLAECAGKGDELLS